MRTLLTNGRIHSPWARDAGAMLVDSGEIAWLGDAASAGSVATDRILDLQGALVVPAFVDAHFHATDTGLALTGLDLSDSTGLRDLLDRLEQRARRTGGRPILGSGWDDTRWAGDLHPVASQLDRASYGSIVYLSRTDAHSAVVSSALMAAVPGLAELDGFSPDGLLSRDAHHAARAVAMGSVTSRQRRDLQRAALRAAAAAGIAAVHEMAGPEISGADDLTALLQLSRDEDLPEVYGYWGELGGARTAAELGAVGAGGDLFCDGSIGSHTAALSQPYADSDTTGYLRFETRELAEHIADCTRAGLQAGFHAIGDAAVGQVIDAMQLAATQLAAELARGAVAGAGHRIEHAELIPSIMGLAEAGLLASVQPAFDAAWGGTDGMYATRLGIDRASSLNPLAQLAAAGVPLAFGSDTPVTPIDPWGAVRAAVQPSNPRHALSARAAFGAHTRGGWRAARAESDGSGVLAPGAPATYAVFAAGPLAVDAPDDRIARWSTDERAAVPGLPELAPGVELPRCLRTVLRGVQIFDSGELE